MSARIPSSRTPSSVYDATEDEMNKVVGNSKASEAPAASKADNANALWRIPEWFPDFPVEAIEKLKAYHTELIKFNLRLNLISRNTERDSDETHFADCLIAYDLLRGTDLGPRVFDAGSGNGFPGVLFATLDSRREYCLIESDSRKCEFLKHMIAALKLKNAQVLNVRLEALKGEDVGVAICRGFASMSKTLLACNRIFKPGGRIYHLKGSGWSSEVAEIPSQLMSIWKPELVGEYSLPVSQARRAVVCTLKK